METYKTLDSSTVQRQSDLACITIPPPGSEYTPGGDYRQYLADVAAGATVLPADPPPEPDDVPPSKNEMLQELLDSIDPDDLTTDALQIMLMVQKEQLRP